MLANHSVTLEVDTPSFAATASSLLDFARVELRQRHREGFFRYRVAQGLASV